jgi:DnaJ domain
MAGVVVLLVFVLGFIAVLVYTLVPLVNREIARDLQRYRLARTERAMRAASVDGGTVRLVMLLRDDLHDSSRAQDKLRQLAVQPAALRALTIALKCRDRQMQQAAIYGLSGLNRPEGVAPLLAVKPVNTTVATEARQALTSLARIAPVRGPASFLVIFEDQLGRVHNFVPQSSRDRVHQPVLWSGWFRQELLRTEALLNIAAERRTQFETAEYTSLFVRCHLLSEQLALSPEIDIRHVGKEFGQTVGEIQSGEAFRHQTSASAGSRQPQSGYDQQETYGPSPGQPQRQAHASAAGENYYEILQVDPSAEQQVITWAYHRLAPKYHPDKYEGADATRRMQQLDEAYAVIGDPFKRKAYDNLLSGHGP